jgi:hypothetical protein
MHVICNLIPANLFSLELYIIIIQYNSLNILNSPNSGQPYSVFMEGSCEFSGVIEGFRAEVE